MSLATDGIKGLVSDEIFLRSKIISIVVNEFKPNNSKELEDAYNAVLDMALKGEINLDMLLNEEIKF